MAIVYFKEVDDCIIAAYNHVKTTGYKVQNHFTSEGGDAVGLIADDGNSFMIWMEFHNSSTKRKLAHQIKDSNISIPEFINRRLLPFL